MHRKCKRRGVDGQKKTNLVNLVCERPLIQMTNAHLEATIYVDKSEFMTLKLEKYILLYN